VRTSFCVLLYLLVSSGLCFSQETPSQPRTHVALALSGGGALGYAHIGVLKYFEEHHIPVDAIAGTSMGALVGGFYASGLDSSQLDNIVRTVNMNEIFRTTPNYDNRDIVKKQQWYKTAGIALRFQHNLSLPTGLNSGQPLAYLLSRYTEAYSDLKSFDDLPTPFRCVATDLISTEGFVLDHGSLPLALRSTMALPGIFTPVEWEGRVLVDGGTVDNIPVDAAREMAQGSGVVIAVSLETAPVQAKELNSLSAVLRQVVNTVVLQNERRSKKLADLVIPVQLQQFHNTDFDKPAPIIDAGYQAAQAMAAQLRPYELSDSDWAAYLAARKARTRVAPSRGKIVSVSQSVPEIQKDATAELHRKLPGVADRSKLEDTLSGIMAATSLPAAYYGWNWKENGYNITLEKRATGGEIIIRPALLLQASGGESTRTSLKLAWVRSTQDSYKSRVLGEATIGFDPGLRLEYYKPIDGQAYFFAPGALYQRTTTYDYFGATTSSFVRDRVAGTLYAGLGTWRFAQWRIGTTAGYDRYRPATISPAGVPSLNSGFANLETRLFIDTQDSGTVPSRGTRINSVLGYSFRNYSYPYFDTDFSQFIPFKKGIGALLLGRGATSFGRNLPFYDQFTSGGLDSLSAYSYQKFHANTLAIAGGGAYIALPEWHGVRSLFAAWDEVGRFDLGPQGWQTHNSANAGIFLPTPLGPTGVVLSFTEDAKARFRFVFGRF